MIDRIQQEWGGLDVLINNVGGTETKPGGFEVLSDQDWQKMLEVNLLAAVRLDRAFIPAMIERRSGVVIQISSISHRLPFSNSTLAYAEFGLNSGCAGCSQIGIRFGAPGDERVVHLPRPVISAHSDRPPA